MNRRAILAALAALAAIVFGGTAAMASTSGRPVDCHPTGTLVNTTDPSRDCVIVLPGSTIVVPSTVPGEPEPTTTTTPSPSTTVERPGEDGRPDAFASCSDAEAAGRTNIPSTDPAYSPDLDSDSDGIGCETTNTDDGAVLAPVAVVANPRFTG